MAQANPFDQFDSQQAPVPIAQIRPIIAAPRDPNEAAQEARAQSAEARAVEDQNMQRRKYEQDQRRLDLEQERIRLEGVKVTEGQSKAGGFLGRAFIANSDFSKYEYLGPRSVVGQFARDTAPALVNSFSDPRRQSYEAAQEAFVTAVLRQDSGANIPSEEMASGKIIYFPQPGDSEDVIKQKERQRLIAIEGLKTAAGPLAQIILDKAQQIQETAPPTGAGERFMTEQDKALQAELQGAFDRGAGVEELNAISARYGRGPLQGIEQAIQARDSGTKGIKATVDPSQPNTTMEGIGQGIGSMVEGGINSTIGLVTNPVGQLMYNMIPGNQGEYNTGQIVREALGLPANTDPMGNAIIQGATGAMTGAGLAGMASRVLPGMAGRVASTIASQPIQQVAGGAGAGAGAEFVREQGGGTGAQIAGGLLGGMAAAGGAGVAQALSAPRVAVPAAVQAAERANIPVMTSDVAPPQTFMGKNLQQVGERIPLAGTGGLRASQQDARVAAVKDVLTGYGVGAEGLPDKVWRSVSTKRSDELTKYADMKKQAIAAVNSAGEVPVAATNAAIDDELARLSRISPEGFAPAISILRRWKNDIQGKSLEDIEVLRKQIGEEFKSPELAAVSGEAQKSLNRIYNPLREDMGAFIRANGGSREANKWMIANRRLSELAGDLDKQALKSVLRNGDATPEAVNNLLFSQKRSDVAALYRALTPEGRANARAAIMDKVFQDIGGDMDTISPERFITAVRKQGNAIGVMFSPEEAQRIGGLIKALKLTRRAGEAGVVTNTGQQGVALAGLSGLTGLVGGLLGGAATGGTTVAATFATAGAIGGLARVMESRAARNILLQLSKAKPQEEAPLVKRFIAAINASKE